MRELAGTARGERAPERVPALQDDRRRRRRTIASARCGARLDDRPHPLPSGDGDRRDRAGRPAAARRRRVPSSAPNRAETTAKPHAQPHEPKPRLRAELHLSLRGRAPARGRAPRIPEPEKYRHYRRRAALLADDRRPRRRDLRRGQPGAWPTGCTSRSPGTRAACGPTAACSRAHFAGPRVPHDVTMINWPGNDYRDGSIIDCRRGADARRRSRTPSASASASCTGCRPRRRRAATGPARPELQLRPDVDGHRRRPGPSIRTSAKSRRIVAVTTVVEQDVSAQFQAGPRGRATSPTRSASAGTDRPAPEPARTTSTSTSPLPFQIPLGALHPACGSRTCSPACKNIGTTHITNGCYRLHPVEWNIGEAAGALAAFALDDGRDAGRGAPTGSRRSSAACSPKAFRSPGSSTSAWIIPRSARSNRCSWRASSTSACSFDPDAPLTATDWRAWGGSGPPRPRRAPPARRG